MAGQDSAGSLLQAPQQLGGSQGQRSGTAGSVVLQGGKEEECSRKRQCSKARVRLGTRETGVRKGIPAGQAGMTRVQHDTGQLMYSFTKTEGHKVGGRRGRGQAWQQALLKERRQVAELEESWLLLLSTGYSTHSQQIIHQLGAGGALGPNLCQVGRGQRLCCQDNNACASWQGHLADSTVSGGEWGRKSAVGKESEEGEQT